MELNDLKFEDIKVGDRYSFEKIIDEDMMRKFADMTGNYNPLHYDAEYANNSEFGGKITYGMLLASLFSTLFGMLCPGKPALCLSHELYFKNPLMVGEKAIVSGEVVSKSSSIQVLEIKTIIKDTKEIVVVDGIARVKVRND